MLRKDKKLVFDSSAKPLSFSQRISSILVVLIASFVLGAILSSFVLGIYFTTDSLLNFFYEESNSSQLSGMMHAEFPVEEKMHLLFVYGTLKKGCSRSSVMESSRFIGVAKTTPNYKLYDCGTYPALVASENGGVWGELYEVDDSVMSRLDQIEGVDADMILLYFEDPAFLEKLKAFNFSDLEETDYNGTPVKELSIELSGSDESGEVYETGIFIYFKETADGLEVVNLLAAG